MKKQMILAIALALAAALQAAPAQFAYQGVLKDTANAPLTGPHQLKLRLYDVPSGNKAALWGRTYAVQLDTNGLFNVEVSDVTGTPISGEQYNPLDVVFTGTNVLYIGLTVDGSSGEITPRQKLLPVPFAAVAANVSRASGNFTVAGKLTAQSAEFSGELTANDVTVTESISAATLDVKGGATVQGNLDVIGTISGFGTVPIGGIIMWSGQENEIPTGWALCNGENGTPNLLNRFIVGAGTGGSYKVDDKGGFERVTLSERQIPPHQHTYTFRRGSMWGATDKDNDFYVAVAHPDWTKFEDKTTNSAGGNESHENRPPYYALCFIMRVE